MEQQTIQVRNPATLERISELPVASAADVSAAITRARHAQASWQNTSFAKRAECLYRLRDRLLDEADRLADILTAETGRPRAEVYSNELFYLCNAIGTWAKNSEKYLRPKRIKPHFPLVKTKKVISIYAPRGVIGIISPWNFPLIMTLGEAIPALMAGNAVIIKPSELTPLSAIFGAEAASKSGFPEHLLQVIVGYGATGEALIDHADMIVFTGSVDTGKRVMRRAADRLVPVSLELGGKDPLIVLKDADLDRAAGACVWGALMNCGQICTSIERVYVEAPIYQPFVDKVVERVRAIRQGPSADQIDLGSMTSEAQLEKIAAQVDAAVASGAKALTGGRRNPAHRGYYYEPTVLIDVTHAMNIMTEETFGPVIPIMKVDNAETALSFANDSRYGLSGSIFSGDKTAALHIAERLQSGAVCINDSLVNFIIPDAPMGGRKDSGFGCRHGAEGIRKFCHQKTIVVDRFGLKEEFPWYPATAEKTRQVRHLLNLLCHTGWRHKFKAFKGLLSR
ncbi:MAG TPA: succinic semialdehyde dehydrogenase [Candidatus Limnocylindrales bacterium]|nr:succinic semialdehyde dehydrogenase [Candidatus Limnocylindrales bacterium]